MTDAERAPDPFGPAEGKAPRGKIVALAVALVVLALTVYAIYAYDSSRHLTAPDITLTGRSDVPPPEGIEPATGRRPPLKLPGPPVSEILIAQRKRVSNELGRELHGRATRRESLSTEERELLDAWYLLLDRDERERMGLSSTEADEDTP